MTSIEPGADGAGDWQLTTTVWPVDEMPTDVAAWPGPAAERDRSDARAPEDRGRPVRRHDRRARQYRRRPCSSFHTARSDARRGRPAAPAPPDLAPGAPPARPRVPRPPCGRRCFPRSTRRSRPSAGTARGAGCRGQPASAPRASAGSDRCGTPSPLATAPRSGSWTARFPPPPRAGERLRPAPAPRRCCAARPRTPSHRSALAAAPPEPPRRCEPVAGCGGARARPRRRAHPCRSRVALRPRRRWRPEVAG